MQLQAIPGFEPFGDDAIPEDTSDPGVAAPVQAPTSTPAASSALPLAPLPGASVIAPAPAPSTSSASRRAGIAVLLAGTGVATGALVGGAWGAGSGLLAAGALMNAYNSRVLWSSAAAADRQEAVKTTVMAVVCLGAAGYLGYRARRDRDE